MFKIGDSFQLRNLAKPDQTLNTKIIEIDENNLYIQEPVDATTSKSVFIARGDNIEVTYKEPDSAVYMFKTEVVMSIAGAMPMFVLRKPIDKEIKRIQRRNYVRVETMIDLETQPADVEFEPFKAYSLNISGGGIAISLPRDHHLKEEMKIFVQFKLPMASGESYGLKVLGRVVRIVKREDYNDKASIEFIDIADIDRRNIIRYTFEQQLAERKAKLK